MAKQPIVTSLPSSGPQRVVPTTYEKHLDLIQWRGINFPYADLKSNLEQQLVAHEYPDKDAAHVESMGRKPLIISCRALFFNHLVPGNGETWKAGDLFPGVFNKFLIACQDSSPGIFSHPIFGDITVKCHKIDTTLDASARGGVVADVTWIETVNVSASAAQSVNGAREEAQAMMEELENVTLTLPPNFPSKISLLDLMDAIGGFISSIELVGMQLLAAVDRVLFHVNNLLKTINRVVGPDGTLLGKLRMLANKLKTTMLNIKITSQNLLIAPAVYTLSVAATAAEIAKTLGVSVADLVKLNPRELSKPVVAQGTRIKYVAK